MEFYLLVQSVHLMFHSAFERAVKERLIPRNPTNDCIAPKVQKVKMKTLRPNKLICTSVYKEKIIAVEGLTTGSNPPAVSQ